MERDIIAELSNLTLHVLEEYDEEYRTYVARCLETGAVANGETLDEAHALIKQVLESDILLAIKAGNLRSFYHMRAGADAWDRWHASSEFMQKDTLEIQLPLPKRGVQSAALHVVKSTGQQVA